MNPDLSSDDDTSFAISSDDIKNAIDLLTKLIYIRDMAKKLFSESNLDYEYLLTELREAYSDIGFILGDTSEDSIESTVYKFLEAAYFYVQDDLLVQYKYFIRNCKMHMIHMQQHFNRLEIMYAAIEGNQRRLIEKHVENSKENTDNYANLLLQDLEFSKHTRLNHKDSLAQLRIINEAEKLLKDRDKYSPKDLIRVTEKLKKEKKYFEDLFKEMKDQLNFKPCDHKKNTQIGEIAKLDIRNMFIEGEFFFHRFPFRVKAMCSLPNGRLLVLNENDTASIYSNTYQNLSTDMLHGNEFLNASAITACEYDNSVYFLKHIKGKDLFELYLYKYNVRYGHRNRLRLCEVNNKNTLCSIFYYRTEVYVGFDQSIEAYNAHTFKLVKQVCLKKDSLKTVTFRPKSASKLAIFAKPSQMPQIQIIDFKIIDETYFVLTNLGILLKPMSNDTEKGIQLYYKSKNEVDNITIAAVTNYLLEYNHFKKEIFAYMKNGEQKFLANISVYNVPRVIEKIFSNEKPIILFNHPHLLISTHSMKGVIGIPYPVPGYRMADLDTKSEMSDSDDESCSTPDFNSSDKSNSLE